MHALYLVSVGLHILAVTAWLGGMLFLVLVVVPWMRANGPGNAGAFLRETGTRFRRVGWWCFGIIFATGVFNLYVRGVRLGSFSQIEWLRSGFAHLVFTKLLVFALVLGLSIAHDFLIGPAATRAMENDPKSDKAMRARKLASLFGRINVVLALVLVALGVMIVRGMP